MRLLNLPGAPLLLPRVGGSTDPAAALREVCRRAVDDILDHAVRRVIILAPGDHDADWPTELPDPIARLTGGPSIEPTLPVPLAVGRHLLADRLNELPTAELIMRTVGAAGPDGPGSDGPGFEGALIVSIADGSALARPGGPAAVHPRADEFDESVVGAWRCGDPSGLAELDSALAAEVMATGGPVWRRLATLARSADHATYHSKINFADAPFGVFSLIASWR